MFADLPDYMMNVNGTSYCPSAAAADSPGLCNNYSTLAAVPGATSTLDQSFPGGTGLGTVTLTYNPGPGSYFVNLWLFENLFPPSAQNEYGATGGGGLAAGESWQIDVPDHTYGGELGTAGAGSIVANTKANTLADTNFVPGKTDDFSFNCTGPTCNDYTSMALGLSFALAAGDEEVLTFTVSKTKPASGFYLEQVAPVDQANPTEIDYFYSATATTEKISGVPEPKSWIFLGAACIIMLAFRRRMAA